MKRLLAGTLAALMLLTAASCGKTNGEETTASSTADTSGTTEATEYTPTEQNWPDGFDYTAINLADYIKLGKYKGVTVTLTTSSEITAADVEKYIEDVRTQHSRTVEITDRGAKNGDELERMYVGSLRRAVEGDVDNGTIMSGQIAAVVHERKSAKEVIDELVSEAEALGGCTLQQMADANAARRRMGL